jgi:uncharacterized membrane protein
MRLFLVSLNCPSVFISDVFISYARCCTFITHRLVTDRGLWMLRLFGISSGRNDQQFIVYVLELSRVSSGEIL